MKQENKTGKPFQKIGEIKIFVNSRKLTNCDFTIAERKTIGIEIQKLYDKELAKFEDKNLLYVECSISESGDLILVINIFVQYEGLHSNISKYPKILEFLHTIVENYKGAIVNLNNEKFSSAVMECNLASYSMALKLFERAESEMLKESFEGKFVLFDTENDLEKHFVGKIKENFHFINCHRLTGIHEVDIKMLESRYCLAMGFTQAALSMLFITAEEALKTILKYNLIKKRLGDSKEEPNLTEVGKVSSEAQKKYGSEPLGVCIKLAKEENIITDDEESKFKEMVKLRDGYIHSDKSRIFSKNKFPVQLVKFEGNELKLVETKEMNMNELIFGQGLAQKNLSDREAKRIFLEVEEMIFSICGRFMKTYKTSN